MEGIMGCNLIFEDFSIKVDPEIKMIQLQEEIEFIYESIIMDLDISNTYNFNESVVDTFKEKFKSFIDKIIDFFKSLLDKFLSFINGTKEKFVTDKLINDYKAKFMENSNESAIIY